MNKLILIIVILGVVIIILAAFLFWPTPIQSPVVQQPPADIEVFGVKANDDVSSPLKITGIVRGGGWTGFEGQVGTVHVMDANNNELAVGILTAATDWMQLPTSFEVTVTFTAVSGTLGSLVFKNENPSGDLVRNKALVLPVTFN